jgi:hypothetical protein
MAWRWGVFAINVYKVCRGCGILLILEKFTGSVSSNNNRCKCSKHRYIAIKVGILRLSVGLRRRSDEHQLACAKSHQCHVQLTALRKNS